MLSISITDSDLFHSFFSPCVLISFNRSSLSPWGISTLSNSVDSEKLITGKPKASSNLLWVVFIKHAMPQSKLQYNKMNYEEVEPCLRRNIVLNNYCTMDLLLKTAHSDLALRCLLLLLFWLIVVCLLADSLGC